jgi:hypothetical protein
MLSLLLGYDIYSLQLGFHLVAVAGKLVQKRKEKLRVYTKREIIYKTTKAQNTQNRKQIYKTRKQTLM